MASEQTIIDPHLEGGAVALAEELLQPDKERTARALQLQTASQRYHQLRARVDDHLERVSVIGSELRTVASESERKRLTKERRELSAELVHAPDDVKGAAEEYADALEAWAPGVAGRAKALARKERAACADHTKKVARERRRAFDPGRPAHAEPSDGDKKKARKAAAEAQAEADPYIKRAERLEDLANQATGCRTSKFGDNLKGPGQRRWIEGVTRAVADRTTHYTGIEHALRPRSMAG